MKNELFEYEKNKYNIIHEFTGTDRNQIGYGRQIKELLSKNNKFHRIWRESLENKSSFLEIGLGAGEIIRFFSEKEIDYLGIDISDLVVEELKKEGLNVEHMSCDNMSEIKDGQYDVVQHLDGMEHIPEECELDTLKEELRVSKKYVFHANAMGDAYLDSISKKNGFNEVHINIKDENGWDDFYEKNKEKLEYKIMYKEVENNTYYVILEKNTR